MELTHEEHLAERKLYRQKNADRVNQYSRNWYAKHKEEVREREGKKKEQHRTKYQKYRQRLRDAVYAVLGHVCVHCAFSDKRALQVDHLQGGGHQEWKRLRTQGVYKRVVLYPEEYQLLCANCNWIKRYDNDEVFFRSRNG